MADGAISQDIFLPIPEAERLVLPTSLLKGGGRHVTVARAV